MLRPTGNVVEISAGVPDRFRPEQPDSAVAEEAGRVVARDQSFNLSRQARRRKATQRIAVVDLERVVGADQKLLGSEQRDKVAKGCCVIDKRVVIKPPGNLDRGFAQRLRQGPQDFPAVLKTGQHRGEGAAAVAERNLQSRM